LVTSHIRDQLYKFNNIAALSPHAISLARSGDQTMIDTILRIARVSNTYAFMDSTIREPTPTTTLISPYTRSYPWDQNTISEWAAVVSAVPYSEEVGVTVVDMLLRLAKRDTVRECIPIDVWVWLKKPSSLPPRCQGRDEGTEGDIVRHIRRLRDLDILKSYFLLVWSEWGLLRKSGFDETQASIVEDLAGIEMQHHRTDLIKRLDQVLGELDRGLEHLKKVRSRITEDHVHKMKGQYRRLREALWEVDRGAMRILAGTCKVDRFQFQH
jgi:hypothetical protein